MKGVALAAVDVVGVGAQAAAAVPPSESRPIRMVASTYGWPSEGWGEEHQPLAGCGFREVGGFTPGRRLPCSLNRHRRIVASRSLPLGTVVMVYYGKRRCHAVVGDRGPYANGADLDIAYACAAVLRFPYSVESVAVRIVR